MGCKTAKQMWDLLEVTHEAAKEHEESEADDEETAMLDVNDVKIGLAHLENDDEEMKVLEQGTAGEQVIQEDAEQNDQVQEQPTQSDQHTVPNPAVSAEDQSDPAAKQPVNQNVEQEHATDVAVGSEEEEDVEEGVEEEVEEVEKEKEDKENKEEKEQDPVPSENIETSEKGEHDRVESQGEKEEQKEALDDNVPHNLCTSSHLILSKLIDLQCQFIAFQDETRVSLASIVDQLNQMEQRLDLNCFSWHLLSFVAT
ncbi:uncharacterized protein LOC130824881 [Amaranthus tricolor]|uniref:uncharacterized protein LOC130824881 n=1 Tax=Amaranthus tricolor TaxID=29722 RepID=UPI0025890BF2|nr:uncharacterized protein LOC130824881 [Amaranthus tricolor]